MRTLDISKTWKLLPNGKYVSTHPSFLEETEHPAALPQDITGFIHNTTNTDRQKGNIIGDDMVAVEGRTNKFIQRYWVNNTPITITRELRYDSNTCKLNQHWNLLVYTSHRTPYCLTYKTGRGLVARLRTL